MPMLAPRAGCPALLDSPRSPRRTPVISDISGSARDPPVEATRLRRPGAAGENENPVPPARVFWTSRGPAHGLNTPVCGVPDRTTKHARAGRGGRRFIQLGELGRNSSADIMRLEALAAGGDLGGRCSPSGSQGTAADMLGTAPEQLVGGLDRRCRARAPGSERGARERVSGERQQARAHVPTSAAWSRTAPEALAVAAAGDAARAIALVARVNAAAGRGSDRDGDPLPPTRITGAARRQRCSPETAPMA